MTSAARAGVLAIVALLIYGAGLTRSRHELLPAEVALARQTYSIAQTGRDLDGHRLPLFVHGDNEVWFPPIPAYGAALAVAIAPASPVAVRWPSVLSGIATLVLAYYLALALFGSASLAMLSFAIALATPALYQWSHLALDGIFAVPFVTGALVSAVRFLDTGRIRLLAIAGGCLGLGFYSGTTAPTQMPIYVLLIALTMWIAGRRQAATHLRLLASFVIPLLALVPWFLFYPESYPDTLGRWAIHAAHIRNPLDGLRAIVNWGSLTNRASVYWEFLNPAFLFFPSEQPSTLDAPASGPMLAALIILIPIGIARVFRVCSSAIATLLLAGFVVAPLAAATFGEDHATGRVLTMFPLAAVLATFGVDALWSSASRLGKPAAALLLALASVQFGYFLMNW